MHLQPVYRKMKIFDNSSFSASEMIARKGFYIPSGLGITIKEQNKVINTLVDVFKNIN